MNHLPNHHRWYNGTSPNRCFILVYDVVSPTVATMRMIHMKQPRKESERSRITGQVSATGLPHKPSCSHELTVLRLAERRGISYPVSCTQLLCKIFFRMATAAWVFDEVCSCLPFDGVQRSYEVGGIQQSHFAWQRVRELWFGSAGGTIREVYQGGTLSLAAGHLD